MHCGLSLASKQPRQTRHCLNAADGKGPACLLLSATPYLAVERSDKSQSDKFLGIALCRRGSMVAKDGAVSSRHTVCSVTLSLSVVLKTPSALETFRAGFHH